MENRETKTNGKVPPEQVERRALGDSFNDAAANGIHAGIAILANSLRAGDSYPPHEVVIDIFIAMERSLDFPHKKPITRRSLLKSVLPSS